MIVRPSPNFDERDPATPLRYVVLHYTGMKTRDEALQRLCDPAAKVSAHYLIDEAGQVFRLVDEEKRAWHAGQSFWRGAIDLNSASIGIELANPGHEFGYVPFSVAQIEALKILLSAVTRRHGLDSETALLGHSDIAPDRKIDPGELFPWPVLAEAGHGIWPEPAADDAPAAEGEVQRLLGDIGYDPAAKSALKAFQRRYDPFRLNGRPEKETVAKLRALARIYDDVSA